MQTRRISFPDDSLANLTAKKLEHIGKVNFSFLSSIFSEEEGQLVKIHIRRNVSDFAPIDSYLVS